MPLLALKMEGSSGRMKDRSQRAEVVPADNQQVSRISVQQPQGMTSANNLNELGSEASRASR